MPAASRYFGSKFPSTRTSKVWRVRLAPKATRKKSATTSQADRELSLEGGWRVTAGFPDA
jgi:hypothetical protein